MDPYVYPRTNVLRNRRDLRDPSILARFEADFAARRQVELAAVPPSGKFDSAHVRQVHHYLFQDVYDWAGQYRTVTISRGGQFPFAFPDMVPQCIDDLCAKLARENRLGGLNRRDFCQRAAFYLGEINAIHPFREGNGRTQREFLRQLAAAAGFHLSWAAISREAMVDASVRSFLRGDNSGFAALILTAIG